MFRYTTNRLLSTIPVLLGIVFVTMLTLDLIPGDPVAMMLGDNARPEEVAALRTSLGLDQTADCALRALSMGHYAGRFGALDSSRIVPFGVRSRLSSRAHYNLLWPR